MARLKAGVSPTPHKERLKGYRADLAARGGRRVSADLEAHAVAALDAIVERDGGYAKDAITNALIAYARPPEQRGEPVTVNDDAQGAPDPKATTD